MPNSMEGYFGTRNAAVRGSSPANARIFGFIIQNRKLKRKFYKGLRGDHIPFQYIDNGVPPERARSANYDMVDVIGRFESQSVYKNTSNSDISFKLKYYAEGSEALNHRTFWTVEQIERIAKKLEALVMPAYDGKFSPPDFVLFNMGSIYIDYPLKIKEVKMNFKPPFDTRTLQSRFLEIDISATSSFPSYQAIGSGQLYSVATERRAEIDGNRVYAYKKFSLVGNQ